MSTLVLRLAAPMQSWGMSSRFTRRTTELQPTKSGVLGLLAAAEGRRRTDLIEDLTSLRFGVRIDQAGHVEQDFQTAHTADGSPLPLSHRYYLADAVFVAAVEGDDTLVGALHDAVRRPAFPLYLGRRAFPPAGPVAVEVHSEGIEEVLRTHPWQASKATRRRLGTRQQLDVAIDADPDGKMPPAGAVNTCADVPVSFDPARRRYGVRQVVRYRVPNPDYPGTPGQPGGGIDGHDPMSSLEG